MVPLSTIASSGAAAGVVDDVPVADVVVIVIVAGVVAVAVAVASPTLHREIHRTCYQSGEDTYYTRGTRDSQDAVQRRW
jgi:hypothetical protein